MLPTVLLTSGFLDDVAGEAMLMKSAPINDFRVSYWCKNPLWHCTWLGQSFSRTFRPLWNYVKNGKISLHSTLNHGKSKSNIDIKFKKFREEIKSLFIFFWETICILDLFPSVKLEKVWYMLFFSSFYRKWQFLTW